MGKDKIKIEKGAKMEQNNASRDYLGVRGGARGSVGVKALCYKPEIRVLETPIR
jgi:hypothetical protein